MSTREVIKGFEKISQSLYKEKVSQSTYIPQIVGNCYTASVFMGLMSLIHLSRDNITQKLSNKKIAIFSYGSGTLASIYTLKVNSSSNSIKQLKQICINNDIQQMLKHRTKINCIQFTEILNKRDGIHKLDEKHGDIFPSADIKQFVSVDAYYLTKIDRSKQRFYEKNNAEIEKSSKQQELDKNITNPYLDNQLIAKLNEMAKEPQQQKLRDHASTNSFKDFDPTQLQQAVDGVIAKTSSCYY